MFNSSFLNTLILLGYIQGFIIGSLIFFSTINRRSNRLLATILLLIALASLKVYLNSQDLAKFQF